MCLQMSTQNWKKSNITEKTIAVHNSSCTNLLSARSTSPSSGVLPTQTVPQLAVFCLPKIKFSCIFSSTLLLTSALESGDCLGTVCALFSSAEFEFLSLGLTGCSSLIGLLSKCPGTTMAQAFSSSSSSIHYTYPWQLQLLLKRKQRH